MLNVTVCELPNDLAALEPAWDALCTHTREAKSDLVLLPEIPFSVWLADRETPSADDWDASVAANTRWIERLGELETPAVAATRPTSSGGARHNVGFLWTAAGVKDVHAKTYLPNEPGFWEATWYDRGPTTFEPARVGADGPTVGFLICTELWFTRHARDYAAQGVELLLAPRATPKSTTEKWIAGGRVAAAVSGAYCLSSNFGGGTWAGAGWIIDPEEAEVLARTSPAEPFVTRAIDLELARQAKATYPRYVDDSPLPAVR